MRQSVRLLASAPVRHSCCRLVLSPACPPALMLPRPLVLLPPPPSALISSTTTRPMIPSPPPPAITPPGRPKPPSPPRPPPPPRTSSIWPVSSEARSSNSTSRRYPTAPLPLPCLAVLGRFLDRSHRDDLRSAFPRLTTGRFTGNVLYRAAAPFLPNIAAGLGVSLETMGVALSVGELSGLSAPPLGRAIDRADRRRTMTAGLVILAAAGALAAASPTVVVFALGAITISLGKILYDASMGAWLSDRVAYAGRGRVLGLAETAWAGAMLIGVPVLAVVVASAGWRWAYALAGLANVAALAWIRGGLEPDPPPPPTPTASVRAHLTGFVGSLPVFGAVGLLMAASSLVVVVFGAWLEDVHDFSAAGVGAVAFLLGAVELVASTSAVRFTDRVGKPVAVAIGATVMVPAAIGLALVGGSVVPGIALLALFVLGFEFALVSSVPLVSELHPEARASSLGLALGFGTVGRGIAAIVATRLYTTHGIGAPSVVAAACAAVVALVMATVREPEFVQPTGCS